jgi:hypothetical protein
LNEVRPAQLVHRGVVEACGLVFDRALAGEEEARRRVLQVWEAGAIVRELPAAYLIRLPVSRPLRVDRAAGIPLVEVEGVGLAAPLTSAEIRRMEPARGSVLLVRGGWIDLLEPGPPVDVARWLDLSSFAIVEPDPVKETIESLRLVAAPEPFEGRTRFAGVPPAAAERDAVIEALGGGRGKASVRGSWINRLGQKILTAFAAAWRAEPSPKAGRSVSVRPSLLRRALRSLLFPILRAAGALSWLGHRHARYIRALVDDLESGALDEALRRAIPLADATTLPSELHLPPFFMPRLRNFLRPDPSRRKSTVGSIAVPHDLFSQLRALYRLAFHRLESAGRIEEAAFVLSELLQSNEEAVSFLERHGRLRLAAELAEGRDLAPGLVVRQWFLAGEREHAVTLARRTGALSDAVLRLERSGRKDEAARLRRIWAAVLADAGDYGPAVEVLWPLDDARSLALSWIDRALEDGGPAGARMLARRLSILPDSFDSARGRIEGLLESEDPEGAPARLVFAQELARAGETVAAKTAARLAARALVRDATVTAEARSLASGLARLAGDDALRADLPAIPPFESTSLLTRPGPMSIEMGRADSGMLPIYDAAWLPNGRLLVALGEVGVRLLGRDGNTLVHFDTPAHQLVVSDAGNRAIGLAARGEVFRLSRVDLSERRARSWCDVRVDTWARDYDGSMWFAAEGSRLMAVDALATRWDALWQVTEVGEAVMSLSRNRSRLSLLTRAGPADLEQWTYELPALVLRSRDDVASGEPANAALLALAPEGVVATLRHVITVEGGESFEELEVWKSNRLSERVQLDFGSESDRLTARAEAFGLPVRTAEGVRVFLFDGDAGWLRLQIRLTAARRASLRLDRRSLTVADDRGRILVFDLARGAQLCNLRL